MGSIEEDIERYKEVGETRREDLKDFIQKGDMGDMIDGKEASIPIKNIINPEFEYDQSDMGGVGQGQGGQPQPGDPAGPPQPADDGEEGEPGDEGGEHEYYEMDPEEFAEELDEELGLDLEPKGKEVIDEEMGDFTRVESKGNESNLIKERLFKKGRARRLAIAFDEDYLREMMKVDGFEPHDVFEEAKMEDMNVSFGWIENEYNRIPEEELDTYGDLNEFRDSNERRPPHEFVPTNELELRESDKKYRKPEIEEIEKSSAVVVNIRDVSGSMRDDKKELVERTFVPMDYYLRGKYDDVHFVYIAHDKNSWEVEASEFFGIDSGGGTKISSAYKLAKHILDGDWHSIAEDEDLQGVLKEDHPDDGYPWANWNRFVFAAGDSENSRNDTEDYVIPLMEDIDANLHAYVETQPNGGSAVNAHHAETVEDYFEDDSNVVVSYVNETSDCVDAIYDILSSEGEDDEG